MCGITGFCNLTQTYTTKHAHWEDVLTQMRMALLHRGTDSTPLLQTHIGICANGILPAGGGTDAGTFSAVSLDGTIFNAEELQQEFFVSDCPKTPGYSADGMLLLSLYQHTDTKFLSRLNAAGSFALWDEAAQKLLLVRDRIGAKPLFYTFLDHTLVFASEPKALFLFPGITPSIDADSLRELLAVGPARTPGNGWFCGIHEVLPGHILTLDRDGIHDSVYWELESRIHTDSYDDTKENVSFLVRDAVMRQMVSDTPLCSFLSGGLDSGIVTSIAAARLRERNSALATFSFDFAENDIYFQSNTFQPERDLPYVRQMADYCGTQHTYLECNTESLCALLDTAVDVKDMPGMTDVDASLIYFCSQVKKNAGTALTGECADEIFGGYPWFYRTELLHRDGFPWSADMSARTAFLAEDVMDDLHLPEYASACYQTALSQVPRLDGESAEDARRREIAFLNIKWFMQTLLDRMDRAGSYCGLNARVPFADVRILSYVFNIPWQMKYQNGVEKALLRDACKDLLPDALFHRKKSPYPKTYHPGYEKMLAARFCEILNNSNAPILPLIDKKKALTFMEAPKEYGKPWFGQLMAGPQLMAYFIQINYWMEKYHLSV